MKPLLLVALCIWLLPQYLFGATTNESPSMETNFVHGAELSPNDLEEIVKLANLCGIQTVTGVSTERHLSGAMVLIRGDDRFEGRKVLFKTLVARREGWPGGDRKEVPAKSVGSFWIKGPTEPRTDERTIVRVGDRTFRVGLSNGITPAGADQVVEAFVTGRIRYAADVQNALRSDLDFSNPNWLGISGVHAWISFTKPGPLTRVEFQLKDKEVTVLSIIRMYE